MNEEPGNEEKTDDCGAEIRKRRRCERRRPVKKDQPEQAGKKEGDQSGEHRSQGMDEVSPGR